MGASFSDFFNPAPDQSQGEEKGGQGSGSGEGPKLFRMDFNEKPKPRSERAVVEGDENIIAPVMAMASGGRRESMTDAILGGNYGRSLSNENSRIQSMIEETERELDATKPGRHPIRYARLMAKLERLYGRQDTVTDNMTDLLKASTVAESEQRHIDQVRGQGGTQDDVISELAPQGPTAKGAQVEAEADAKLRANEKAIAQERTRISETWVKGGRYKTQQEAEAAYDELMAKITVGGMLMQEMGPEKMRLEMEKIEQDIATGKSYASYLDRQPFDKDGDPASRARSQAGMKFLGLKTGLDPDAARSGDSNRTWHYRVHGLDQSQAKELEDRADKIVERFVPKDVYDLMQRDPQLRPEALASIPEGEAYEIMSRRFTPAQIENMGGPKAAASKITGAWFEAAGLTDANAVTSEVVFGLMSGTVNIADAKKFIQTWASSSAAPEEIRQSGFDDVAYDEWLRAWGDDISQAQGASAPYLSMMSPHGIEQLKQMYRMGDPGAGELYRGMQNLQTSLLDVVMSNKTAHMSRAGQIAATLDRFQAEDIDDRVRQWDDFADKIRMAEGYANIPEPSIGWDALQYYPSQLRLMHTISHYVTHKDKIDKVLGEMGQGLTAPDKRVLEDTVKRLASDYQGLAKTDPARFAEIQSMVAQIPGLLKEQRELRNYEATTEEKEDETPSRRPTARIRQR